MEGNNEKPNLEIPEEIKKLLMLPWMKLLRQWYSV